MGQVADVERWRTDLANDPTGAAAAAWARILELQELGRSDNASADQALNELFRAGGPVTNLDGPTDGILVLTTMTKVPASRSPRSPRSGCPGKASASTPRRAPATTG